MSRHLALCLLLATAVAACQRTAPAPASADAPSQNVATHAGSNRMAASGPARLDGYGPVSFGMTAAELAQAWKRPLRGGPTPGNICYELIGDTGQGGTPLTFMVEADKFVRYVVHGRDVLAPGGGRTGMSADDIRRLYAGLLQEQPDGSRSGGVLLRIGSTHAERGVVVFETDAHGDVTGWRVGQPPQVDYPDGCG